MAKFSLQGSLGSSADIRDLKSWIENNKDDSDLLVHLGDIGIHQEPLSYMAPNFRFLRGEWDSPSLCRQSLEYLGDWGFLEFYELFYVSGAKSTSLDFRQPYRNLWPEEELSESELQRAFNQYLLKRPTIVFSHGFPASLGEEEENLTSSYLQKMLDSHAPKIWIFSHLETSFDKNVSGVRFISLAEKEVLNIEL